MENKESTNSLPNPDCFTCHFLDLSECIDFKVCSKDGKQLELFRADNVVFEVREHSYPYNLIGFFDEVTEKLKEDSIRNWWTIEEREVSSYV